MFVTVNENNSPVPPAVQAALTILIAFLLKLGATALKIEIDDAFLAKAASIIVLILLGQSATLFLKQKTPKLFQ